MVKLKEFYTARKRIQKWIRKTPLEYSPILSKLIEGSVYLKLENQQVTRSFKIRGAANKILQLTDDEKARGIIAASSGNHAQGIGYTAKKLGVRAKIIVPKMTPKVKADAIKQYGVELIIEGEEFMESEMIARRIEKEEGMTLVSAYNDADVIAGQGTIALEMIEEIPDLEIILVPVGAGGLMAGVGLVYKQATDAKIIGVQGETSPVMYESIKKDYIHDIPMQDTYAEGLHGGIEKDAITFDICKKVIDDWVILTEDEILEAIRFLVHECNMLVEGAGGVGVAAILSDPSRYKGKKVGIIISGGNLGMSTLKKVV